MVTYGGMSKRPVTVPTSYFILRSVHQTLLVKLCFPVLHYMIPLCHLKFFNANSKAPRVHASNVSASKLSHLDYAPISH